MTQGHGNASGHPGGGAGARFGAAYAGGPPPWDIGRPQPEIVAAEDAGVFGRRVVDVGCGTGEHALMLAARGHETLGIDAVAGAIEQARSKAAERGLDAEFMLGEVCDLLAEMPGRFDSCVDVGFFHALTDTDRVQFSEALATALVPGGTYVMLCFSDRVPGAWGPRRVSEAEIRTTFAGPLFHVREVRPARLESNREQMVVVDANLAIVERAGG